MLDIKVAVILGFVRKDNESLLIQAITSLESQTYKNFEIHVYDNSCIEDGLSEAKKLFPEVIIQKNDKNIGFAGGNNSVLRKLLKDPSFKYLILLNDDTEPDSKWVETLVKTAESNPNSGAVTSKLVFYEDFVRLELETESVNLKQAGITSDDRNLGINFIESTKFANSSYQKKFFREGFSSKETSEGRNTHWTQSQSRVDLPIGKSTPGEFYELNLQVIKNKYINNQTLKVKINTFETSITLTDSTDYKIKIPSDLINISKFTLIQNAGSAITAQFNGYDIGSVNNQPEKDTGQYDELKEVQMFCGGAVLLNAEVLRKVGIFDEYFFVYYEDADLSLRIRSFGYKIIYQPNALVRHIHAGSSGEYSPFFSFHVWKNKPAFVLKNFGLRPILFACKEIFANTFSTFKSSAKNLFRNGHENGILKVQFKSLCVFFLNIPILFLKKLRIVKSL